MDTFTKSFLLLFVLLNPFILSVYLLTLIRELDTRALTHQLLRAGLISFTIFILFAWAGNSVFEDVLQVRFSSFLIFGGVTFLVIGLRLILGIGPPVETLRPHSDEVSATIAMPFIVGPGTISASVIAGSRLPWISACAVIALALLLTIVAVLLIKLLHDFVRVRDERWVSRYAEVAGRVTALFTGTFAIEMIFSGIERWLAHMGTGPGFM